MEAGTLVERAVTETEFWRAIGLMGHPIRRQILAALSRGRAASISGLTRDLGKAWTTIAYHLDVLEDTGLLTPSYERIPRSWGHVYRINAAKRDAILRTIEQGIEAGLLHGAKNRRPSRM